MRAFGSWAAQRKWLLPLLVGCCCRAADGQSLSSCGGPKDLLQNPKFSVSPDPIQEGEPFNLTVGGTLGAAFTGGAIVIDMNAKVLILSHAIVDEPVQSTTPFSFAPGIPAGDMQVTIGPVHFPPHTPGSADITGNITIQDDSGAQVTCVALDFHFDLFSKSSMPVPPAVAPRRPLRQAESCGKKGDHMSNITTSKKDGVKEGKGTLDEDVTKMTFNADLALHVGWFKVPFAFEVPLAYSPGIKRGPISGKLGPAKDNSPPAKRSLSTVEVTGEVTWNDAAKQEIACMSLGGEGFAAAAAASEEVAVIV